SYIFLFVVDFAPSLFLVRTRIFFLVVREIMV
ncbi:MAG: hypothetical protein ACI9GO_001135, partial [Bacteroidia bacterium]